MSPSIVSIGELLVEIMREKVGEPFDRPGTFVGPFPSGAPAIFSDAAGRLGEKSGMIGTVGEDDFGKLILERLKKDGVDTTYIQTLKGFTTGVAFVTYFPDGSRKFIYHLPHAASGKISSEQINEKYLSEVKYLHIMGSSLSINEDYRNACYKAAHIVKNSRGKVSLDPNLRPELLSIEEIRKICEPILSISDVIMPSGEEATMLTGAEDVESACMKLLEYGPKIVALKQGKEGCTVFTKKEKIKVSSFKVKEVDPTGAGDCFDAGFLVGLLKKGWELPKVAKFANAVGALSVTKKGPMEGAPTYKEVSNLLKEAF